MIAACIVLLYVSYAIPIASFLYRGRENILKGPFFLPRIGLFANIITVAWTLFTIVMYSLPYMRPVQAGNMNYVSVVYAVVAAIMACDWVCRGRKSFRGEGERRLVAEQVVGGMGRA
ncbi:hypothetical protein GQ43DRAFT_9015 [Delitschia confertaspora ATCC 74209]|uniref:Uncharacterized protein n=1 Tax=Delitschia confertaspora ATCC 74209 TaxID=1513339 RepID=A0A9P4JN17_9PLEO|nr:hypothetical protein GQ43DRAFT_9015 [Delitschia confertaspora ATCC 74209]